MIYRPVGLTLSVPDEGFEVLEDGSAPLHISLVVPPDDAVVYDVTTNPDCLLVNGSSSLQLLFTPDKTSHLIDVSAIDDDEYVYESQCQIEFKVSEYNQDPAYTSFFGSRFFRQVIVINDDQPTPVPTVDPAEWTATATPSLSPTPTLTFTPSLTRTPRPTLMASSTRTPTRTRTPSVTPTPTSTLPYDPTLVTFTPSPTRTPTITRTPSVTLTPSSTWTASPTWTRTPTKTASVIIDPTYATHPPTVTRTPTWTRTPTPATGTLSYDPTQITMTPSSTFTATRTPAYGPSPTPSLTFTPTWTPYSATYPPTIPPSPGPYPSNTPPGPMQTSTLLPTLTFTPSPFSPTPTPTRTWTNTPGMIDTETNIPTGGPSLTPTFTITPSPSPSSTLTFTPSITLDPCGVLPTRTPIGGLTPTGGAGGDSVSVRTTPCPATFTPTFTPSVTDLPSLTPEPTGTSEPRQPVQLLINPDFAQPIPDPRGWAITNVPNTRKDDRMRYDADLGVFMFKGGEGEKSKLKQTIRPTMLSFQTGDYLNLIMSYRKKGPQPNLRAKVQILYRDGTPKSTETVNLMEGVSSYRSVSHSIPLQSLAVDSVIVSFIHKSPNKKSKLFIDSVELWWMPTP